MRLQVFLSSFHSMDKRGEGTNGIQYGITISSAEKLRSTIMRFPRRQKSSHQSSRYSFWPQAPSWLYGLSSIQSHNSTIKLSLKRAAERTLDASPLWSKQVQNSYLSSFVGLIAARILSITRLLLKKKAKVRALDSVHIW